MKSAFGWRFGLAPGLKPRTCVKFALVWVTEYLKSLRSTLRLTLPFGAVLPRVVVVILLVTKAPALMETQ
jgi:hypothetical protein